MESNLTAVEWLYIQVINFPTMDNLRTNIEKLVEEAKEMEKQQIIDAYEDGYSDSDNTFKLNEQYYNETFNK
jgi:hypothetical protein